MNPTPHNAIPHADDLDSLLHHHLASPGEQLAPSSGFVLSVMESIHQQAAVPPPIPFPWRRVLPGAIVALCALAAFVFYILAAGPSHTSHANTASAHALFTASTFTSAELTLCWIAVAVCLSIASIAASFHLAGSHS